MLGVEDILEYFDSIYDRSDKKVIMIYLEGLKNPDKFILHSRSLYEKGHRITLLKGGTTQQGNQAASSHTGALARNIETEDSIFQRSGVIRCHSRSELIYTTAIINNFDHLPKRIGIITHAGGPAVLLTDGLIKNGLQVPCLEKSQQTHLKKLLYDGANTSNPIDILATGTSEHLEQCLEYCDKEVDEIDGLVVILGSPGLTDMTSHFKSVLSSNAHASKIITVVNCTSQFCTHTETSK